MAPFSVADLKQRASKAKDASVSKFNDTRDRYSSQPSAKTNWDPNYKRSAPPPPSRSSGTIPPSAPPRPPPVARGSRPQLSANGAPPVAPRPALSSHRTHQEDAVIDHIDWANLSPEDKQIFFSWLDEFFARYLNRPVPPRSCIDSGKHIAETNPGFSKLVSKPSTRTPPTHTPGPPPPIANWSKPSLSSTSSLTSTTNDFILSYPPSSTHGCAAIDLAHYFHPSTHWDSAWYHTENTPPLLRGNPNMAGSSGYRTVGSEKVLFGGAFFSDLSICWWSVRFHTSASDDLNDSDAVVRNAQYLPCPRSMSRDALIDAHETYGETIAAFAESFEGTGEFCARGECWDLANEAISYFKAFDYVPKPVPSLSRTHGHLIFEGRASGKGNVVGRWRGGDTVVRRGDIVEWREVKINVVGGSSSSWVILGVPDHTAVIVRDSPLSRQPADGEPFSPSDIGTIEVVEQSVNGPPARKNYDMSAFEKGEMWIYRPIGMETYLGTLLVPQCPTGLQALTL